MKKITVRYLKKNCAAILREVQFKRRTVVITKDGKPVAKLIPMDNVEDDIFGFLKGKGTISGDVVSSAFTLEEWSELA